MKKVSTVTAKQSRNVFQPTSVRRKYMVDKCLRECFQREPEGTVVRFLGPIHRQWLALLSATNDGGFDAQRMMAREIGSRGIDAWCR